MYRSTFLFPRRVSLLLRSITVVLLTLAAATTAHAQASWNPTLLVNTESFQLIDDGDGSTDIELRFGSSSITIKYLTTGKFQFSRGISVLGTISGSSLNVDRNATIGGTLTASGATNLQSTLTVQGNASFKNNLSGRTLTVDQGASISGSLLVKNNIAAKGALSGSTFYGAGLGVCTGTNQVLRYDTATGKFSCGTISTSNTGTGALQTYFDNRYVNTAGDTMTGTLVFNLVGTNLAINARGVLSGYSLVISRNASISGSLVVKNAISGASLEITGTASGKDLFATKSITGTDIYAASRFAGAGLSSCSNATTSKLLWNSATKQFSCGTDTDTNTQFSGTGALQTYFDNRYVNTSGDTMTGTLVFDLVGTSLAINARGIISGSLLAISSNATISGSLLVKNNIAAKGALSGSTFYGAGLGTCTSAGYGLQYNVATGKFNCQNIAAGASNGSGNIMSLHPEYPNAIYFASGATSVGQMTLSGGTVALDNSYVWTSSRTGIQDYWVSVRVRVPSNFSSWDAVKPIEFRYKTGTATAGQNHLTLRLRDTAGNLVALTNGDNLAATTWTTASVTGPEGSGTFTPGGYMTIYVKMAANNTAGANAAAGFLNLNFETTTP